MTEPFDDSRFLDSETHRILSGGELRIPSSLNAGETAAFASWKRGSIGCVLFIRRWRNGMLDSDCAMAELQDDRWWVACSGGGAAPDPFERPEEGQSILTCFGLTGSTLGADDAPVWLRCVQGMAAP